MTTGIDPSADSRAAYEAWTEHRFFAYRGCAPDSDDPRRSAGDPALTLDAWCGEDRDGAEEQKARRAREAAAIEVCLGCPVMVACDRYANSVTAEGKLAEPDGIRGGRTALERHRGFIQRRHEVAAAAPDVQLRTAQKRAFLEALAAHSDPVRVAETAGLDVRTANWQRSRLVTQLNLCKATATREEILAEAVRRGLLDASRLPGRPDADAGSVSERRAVRVPSPRRDRFADVVGQLALWEAGLPDVELAEVHPLFPAASLEAAA